LGHNTVNNDIIIGFGISNYTEVEGQKKCESIDVIMCNFSTCKVLDIIHLTNVDYNYTYLKDESKNIHLKATKNKLTIIKSLPKIQLYSPTSYTGMFHGKSTEEHNIVSGVLNLIQFDDIIFFLERRDPIKNFRKFDFSLKWNGYWLRPGIGKIEDGILKVYQMNLPFDPVEGDSDLLEQHSAHQDTKANRPYIDSNFFKIESNKVIVHPIPFVKYEKYELKETTEIKPIDEKQKEFIKKILSKMKEKDGFDKTFRIKKQANFDWLLKIVGTHCILGDEGKERAIQELERILYEHEEFIKTVGPFRGRYRNHNLYMKAPIHIAAVYKDLTMIKILVGKGADLHQKDGENKNALENLRLRMKRNKYTRDIEERIEEYLKKKMKEQKEEREQKKEVEREQKKEVEEIIIEERPKEDNPKDPKDD